MSFAIVDSNTVTTHAGGADYTVMRTKDGFHVFCVNASARAYSRGLPPGRRFKTLAEVEAAYKRLAGVSGAFSEVPGMSTAQSLTQPTTLIEEMLRDEAFDRRNRLPLEELIHLEPTELARHIDDTCQGDPRCDYAGHLTDGLDDMPMVDRPKANALVRKLLLGAITVEEQVTLNEICVKAMLAHGVREVRAALEQARKAVRR